MESYPSEQQLLDSVSWAVPHHVIQLVNEEHDEVARGIVLHEVMVQLQQGALGTQHLPPEHHPELAVCLGNETSKAQSRGV